MRPNQAYRWALVLTTLLSYAACTNNDIDPNAVSGSAPSRGSADFTKYVAVGNSLTAGFADGGLYRESQLNSYPNILAGQFARVGGGPFVQPLFSEAQAAGSGYLKLVRVPSVTNPASLLSSFTQVPPGAARGGTTAAPRNAPLLTKFTEPNQNLGVPSLRTADILLTGYGSTQGSEYFERLVVNPMTTYFQYVSDNLNGATFFSCWLGNNDALNYAITGGSAELTRTDLFTTNFTAMMNKLTEGNRKGVVIGIPNLTVAPFFTTVTVPLLLAQLNALTNPPTPLTTLIIQTPNGVRATQAGDLLLFSPLTAAEFARVGSTAAGTRQGPYGLSPTNPLPTQLVLDAGEVATMNARIAEFNAVMKAQADARGIAYVDLNGLLNQLTSATGLVRNGITYSTSYVQGGAYSVDGLHLTPAGYALVANEVIKSINAKYGSTIPEVNPGDYRRVLLQQ